MKFAAWFCLLVGVLMIAQWGFFLFSNQVPELRTEPVAVSFHLAAEGATAAALIAAGVGLLRGKPWARTTALVALGMLLYTVIVSPGYFAQQGAWPLVLMFAGLLVLAVISLFRLRPLS
jgi:hypothetical protein